MSGHSRAYLLTRAVVRAVVWLVIATLLPLYVIAASLVLGLVWR